jgi:hypothetical protein
MPGMEVASSCRKLSCAHSSCSKSAVSGVGSISCAVWVEHVCRGQGGAAQGVRATREGDRRMGQSTWGTWPAELVVTGQ